MLLHKETILKSMATLKMTIIGLFIKVLGLINFANTFENYTLYEVTAFNPHEREILYFIQIRKSSIIFINGVSNEAAIPIDVIARNEMSSKFEAKLQSDGIQYSLISLISEHQLKSKNVLAKTVNISEHFYDWNSILKWIEITEKESSMFQKIVIAKTYESRDIFFLKISQGGKKPIVFIVGGEDGLDWMSSSLVLNLLSEFVENSDFKKLLNIFDFYLMPILNPDGFVYTKEQDRLWSKNRREIYPKTICPDYNMAVGVTISRNWYFDKSSKIAGEECNSVYMGHKTLSEEETQSLSYVLNSLAQDMMVFVNVRGFGRYITVPQANINGQPNNHYIVKEMLKFITYKVHKTHNTTYYIGATSSIFYNFSGNVADWVKSKLNTPIVFSMYLEKTATVLPLPQHIKHLKKDFLTILNESLLMSHDIFHPLFNNKSVIKFNIAFQTTILFILKLILIN